MTLTRTKLFIVMVVFALTTTVVAMIILTIIHSYKKKSPPLPQSTPATPATPPAKPAAPATPAKPATPASPPTPAANAQNNAPNTEISLKESLTNNAIKIVPWFTTQYSGTTTYLDRLDDQGNNNPINNTGLIWTIDKSQKRWDAYYSFSCVKDGVEGQRIEVNLNVDNHYYNAPKIRISQLWEPNPCATMEGATVKVYRRRLNETKPKLITKLLDWKGGTYDGKGAVFVDNDLD